MLVLNVERVNVNQDNRDTGLQRYAEGKGEVDLRADFCFHGPVKMRLCYVVALTNPVFQAHEHTFARTTAIAVKVRRKQRGSFRSIRLVSSIRGRMKRFLRTNTRSVFGANAPCQAGWCAHSWAPTGVSED